MSTRTPEVPTKRRARTYGDGLDACLPAVRITTELSQEVQARAELEKLSVSDLVRLAVREYLDRPPIAL